MIQIDREKEKDISRTQIGKEKDIDTDRQREKYIHRQAERKIYTQIGREKEKDIDRQRERERHRLTERKIQTKIDREKDIGRKRKRYRHRQTESQMQVGKEKDKDTDRQRERQTQKERLVLTICRQWDSEMIYGSFLVTKGLRKPQKKSFKRNVKLKSLQRAEKLSPLPTLTNI